MKKPPMKGKYTEKSDKKMDAYLTRDLDKEEKKELLISLVIWVLVQNQTMWRTRLELHGMR